MILEDNPQEPAEASLSLTIPKVPKGKDAAGNSTFEYVNKPSVNLPKFANAVVLITLLRAAPGQDPCGLPNRPHPWSPIQPFVLECKFSSYPDKIFDKQLFTICSMDAVLHGYTGPQFAHLARNLPTAYQQPYVTLQRKCEAGRILAPFTSPPLNLRTSGLCLILKHDRGWRIIYYLSASHHC